MTQDQLITRIRQLQAERHNLQHRMTKADTTTEYLILESQLQEIVRRIDNLAGK